MGLYDNFPYTNTHELNTDWIVKKIGDIDRAEEASAASAAAAKASEEAAADSQEAAAQSAQNAAGSAADAEADANRIEASAQQIAENSRRIDNIIAQGQSTEGNTELIDARVSAIATYQTVGRNIRANESVNGVKGFSTQKTYANLIDKFVLGNYRNADHAFIPADQTATFNLLDIDLFKDNIFYFRGTDKLFNFLNPTSATIGVYYSLFDANFTHLISVNAGYVVNSTNFYRVRGFDFSPSVTSDTKYIRFYCLFYDTGVPVPEDICDMLIFTNAEVFNDIKASHYSYNFTNNVFEYSPSRITIYVDIDTPYLLSVDRTPGYEGTSYGVRVGIPNGIDLYKRGKLLNIDLTETILEPGRYILNIATEGSYINEAEAFNKVSFKPVDYYLPSYSISSGNKYNRAGLYKVATINGIQSAATDGVYIYTAVGTALSKYDMEFNQLASVSTTFGHGNGMQIGADGYIYISGWEDNKLHKFDPADLSKLAEIDLETTGYTTCAVDTLNDRVFIFQRETRPNTREYYNVLVKQLSTMELLTSFKTYISLGGMQDIDFNRGIITVSYGVGTSEIPTGMFKVNTVGDIVEEYHLNEFTNTEIEAVFTNPLTLELYVSDVAGNFYKVFE